MKINQILTEASGATVAFAFGRFNPAHQGHVEVWRTVEQAGANWFIGTNSSTLGPNDPLTFQQKSAWMTEIYPAISGHIIAEQSVLTLAVYIFKKTRKNENASVAYITDAADWAWSGKLLNQYNGVEGAHGYYKFAEIAHVPSPRVSSATALRDAARADDKVAFYHASGTDPKSKVAGLTYFDTVKQAVEKYPLPVKRGQKVKEGSDDLPQWKKDWYAKQKPNSWPKHPQPYHNPNWIDELSPEEKNKLTGKKDSKKSAAENNLKEFAPGSGGGESGRWYTDDQMTDLVGDGWWNDLDISGDIPKQEMIQEAQAWLDDQGYSVHVLNCKVNDDDMEWFIEGSFQNSNFAKKGVAEDSLGLKKLHDALWTVISEQTIDEETINEIDPGMIANLYSVFPTVAKIIVSNALNKARKEAKETSLMIDVMKKHASSQPVTPQENEAMLTQFKDIVSYGLSAVAGVLTGAVAGPAAGAGVALAGAYKKELLALLQTKGPEVLIGLLKSKGKLDVVDILSAKLLGKHALPFYAPAKLATESEQKTQAKTWDQMTPKEKSSGVKGRTVWNEKTQRYYTVFDVPANEVDEASLATMRDYFAGDEKAHDPMDITKQRLHFAKDKNVKPTVDKRFRSPAEYQAWLKQNKLRQISGANESTNNKGWTLTNKKQQ